MISRIDHVSIAVTDYKKATDFFCNVLGAVPGAGAQDDTMKYVWQVFSLGDMSRLELIHPTGKGSFLDNFLENKTGGAHHITLQTPDIEVAKKVMADHDIPIFGEHEYQDEYWKEFFIHPKHAFGVLIQIAEFNADDFLDSSVKLSNAKKWSVKKKKNGCTLTITHPGGGTADLDLSKEEIRDLTQSLEAYL